jgi:hypothetical protein
VRRSRRDVGEGVDDVSVVIGEEVSHDEDFRRKKELP